MGRNRFARYIMRRLIRHGLIPAGLLAALLASVICFPLALKEETGVNVPLLWMASFLIIFLIRLDQLGEKLSS